MKVVIDTNRIIASLVRDGVSRNIIMYSSFEFISPDFTLDEIKKYENEVLEKSGLSKEEFRVLFEIILDKISIKDKSQYNDKIIGARELIKDEKDLPFIALALAVENDGIWSDDKDFLKQDKIRIFSTGDMIKLFEGHLKEENREQ